MRVIIAGSRNITDYNLVKSVIKESGFEITEVVSGTARGVDRLGEHWAIENNISIKKFPAEWDKYGKSAGYKRNIEMAQYAENLIAICLDDSKGTMHMVNTMRKFCKSIFLKNIYSNA